MATSAELQQQALWVHTRIVDVRIGAREWPGRGRTVGYLSGNIDGSKGERRWRTVRYCVGREDQRSIIQLKDEPMVWAIPLDIKPVRCARLNGAERSKIDGCPGTARIVVTTLIVVCNGYCRSGVSRIAIGANTALHVAQLAGRQTFRVEKAPSKLWTDVHRGGWVAHTP